jgi:hypothetical protein
LETNLLDKDEEEEEETTAAEDGPVVGLKFTGFFCLKKLFEEKSFQN